LTPTATITATEKIQRSAAGLRALRRSQDSRAAVSLDAQTATRHVGTLFKTTLLEPKALARVAKQAVAKKGSAHGR
jgi:hypothetical protein